jgi:hypothetical protein
VRRPRSLRFWGLEARSFGTATHGFGCRCTCLRIRSPKPDLPIVHIRLVALGSSAAAVVVAVFACVVVAAAHGGNKQQSVHDPFAWPRQKIWIHRGTDATLNTSVDNEKPLSHVMYHEEWPRSFVAGRSSAPIRVYTSPLGCLEPVGPAPPQLRLREEGQYEQPAG